jgi:hypothetical protein
LLLVSLLPNRPKPIPDPRARPIVDNPRLEENDRLGVVVDEEEDGEVGSTGREEERHRIDLRGVEVDRRVEVRTRCRVGVDREREDILRWVGMRVGKGLCWVVYRNRIRFVPE